MKIGPLRERVTLEDCVPGVDALGGSTPVYVNSREVWASALPVSGREYLAAGSVAEAQTVRFWLRYNGSFSPAGRLTWRGTKYNVRQVRNVDGRNRLLEVIAVEGVS